MNGESKNLEMTGVEKPEENTQMQKAEYKDFLNKFDSFINESKQKLKSLETQNSK